MRKEQTKYAHFAMAASNFVFKLVLYDERTCLTAASNTACFDRGLESEVVLSPSTSSIIRSMMLVTSRGRTRRSRTADISQLVKSKYIPKISDPITGHS